MLDYSWEEELDLASSKQVAQQILDSLPEDCSLEDISYRIYVRARLEEGLNDLASGRVVPNEQVMREASDWLKKHSR